MYSSYESHENVSSPYLPNNMGGSYDPLLTPLYSVRQIAMATFLASPLAGLWLLAENAETLRDNAGAFNLRVFAVATLFVLYPVCTIWVTRLPLPNTLLPILLALTMRAYAGALQGDLLMRHQEHGGVGGSGGRIFCIVILASLLSLVFFALADWICEMAFPGLAA